METSVSNLEWLWKKVYAYNIGLLLAPVAWLCSSVLFFLFFIPFLFFFINLVSRGVVIPVIISLYMGYCSCIFLYIVYKKVYVYELAFKKILFWKSLFKFLSLIIMSAGIFIGINYLINLSWLLQNIFSTLLLIFLPIFIAHKILPMVRFSETFVQLSKKLRLFFVYRLIFYVLLIVLAKAYTLGTMYSLYLRIGILFMSLFIIILIEECLRYVKLYEQKITKRSLLAIALLSAFCAMCFSLIFLIAFKFLDTPLVEFVEFFALFIVTAVVVFLGSLFGIVQLFGERIFILKI